MMDRNIVINLINFAREGRNAKSSSSSTERKTPRETFEPYVPHVNYAKEEANKMATGDSRLAAACRTIHSEELKNRHPDTMGYDPPKS